jgi:ABC-type multidrug transport system fused ATPase/permease subunit
VAHRLSTIIHCDRIIVLDGGRVAEEGKYQELIEKKGLFYQLVKQQM